MSREVVDPQGRGWTVRRRWTRRPRWRGAARSRLADWLDVGDLGDMLGNLLPALAVILGAIALSALLVFFGIPLLLFVVESVFLLALALAALLSRLLWLRPWTLEAVCEDPSVPPVTRHATGLRASRRAVAALEQDLARGLTG